MPGCSYCNDNAKAMLHNNEVICVKRSLLEIDGGGSSLIEMKSGNILQADLI